MRQIIFLLHVTAECLHMGLHGVLDLGEQNKPDRQCTRNVPMAGVRVTTVAVLKQ